jgi:cytochrome c553
MIHLNYKCYYKLMIALATIACLYLGQVGVAMAATEASNASTQVITPAPASESSNTTANSPSTKSPSNETSTPAVVLPVIEGSGLISGDPLLGQAKSQVCTACHGQDGNSPAPTWPKIAGQIEKYLVKELKEYRKGEQGKRFDPAMSPMTQTLTDSDIADLAAYFSKQTETPGSVKQEYLALGEKIYRGGNLETGVPACIACHGVVGEGNPPAAFPRLSGQYPEYTADQLKKFRAGTRKDDPNGIMQTIAKHMSDEEIQAVSSYVSGYH